MSKTVLIAGGSGLVGKALSEKLLQLGFQVKWLGRKKTAQSIPTYEWDPEKKRIDMEAFSQTDFVINLAGANVGKGKWTPKRKEELINSRLNSTQLLIDCILKNNLPVQKFIQASAIGYYGFKDNNAEFTEEDQAGKDFLAELTNKWENELTPLFASHIDVLTLRIGVVLSDQSGALVEMAKPVRMLMGAPLGSGNQIVPWIHIDDLVSVFLKGIEEKKMTGIYNAVSPNPVTNNALTRSIGKAIKKPVWPFPVPGFILKMLLGEQAQIVLKGNRVSVKKLLNAGFVFDHPNLDETVKDLLMRK